MANLREVSPTLYFNVPRGFDVLLPRLAAAVTAPAVVERLCEELPPAEVIIL